MIRLPLLTVSVIACLLALTGIGRAQPDSPKRPNIVVLFADDLGWSDVSYQGGEVPTPHIDELAASGVVFSAAYAATATCSPSRAALLTGRHPARLSMTRHIPSGRFERGRANQPFHVRQGDPTETASRNWLPLDETTYAEVLRERGYRTGFVGKWHLGHEPYFPIRQGFDEQHGVAPAGHPNSYTPPYFRHGNPYPDAKEGEYLTERLTRDAVIFIDRQPKDQPYHLSVFFYTVHAPIQGPREDVKRFQEQGMSETQANYAGMLVALDRAVGRIVEAVKARGDADKTLILFAGDQGGRFGNEPFRGGKRSETVYEGGSRIPFLITWPDRIDPGRTVDKPVLTTDFMPTVADVVGLDRQELEPLDGISLLDALTDDAPVPDRSVFLYRTYTAEDQALRDGRWKLIAQYGGGAELYDLENDPGETLDLSDQQPEQTQVLLQQLKAWKALMSVQ